MVTFTATIRITATVCEVTAIVTTSLRLYYRTSRRHFGLDDAWATFSLLAAIVLLTGAWLRSNMNLPLDERVSGYFMLVSSFTCVLWSARMSILFSIMRIIPQLMTLRRYTYFGAVLFFGMWLAVLARKLDICTHDHTWQHKKNVQCTLGKSVGALELATDIVADTILVVLPIRLLWGISISTLNRKLLMAIFSASMVTTIVSIVHTAFELSTNRNAEAIAAHVEAAVSLIICNLAVLVTWLVRVLRDGDDIEGWSESSTGGTPRHRSQITSIRFGDRNPGILLTGLGGTTHYELEDDVTQGAQLSTFKPKHDLDTTFTPADGPEVAALAFGAKLKEDTEGSNEAH